MMTIVKNRIHLSQGWLVVTSVTSILTATSGARFLNGVVLKPLSAQHGWDRADLTLAVVINMIVLSACQPVIGAVVDQIGSRRVLAAGVVALAVVLIPISLQPSSGISTSSTASSRPSRSRRRVRSMRRPW